MALLTRRGNAGLRLNDSTAITLNAGCSLGVTDNSTPDNEQASSSIASFEMEAGQYVTLIWNTNFGEVLKAAAPDQCTIQIFYEGATTGPIRTLRNATAQPVDGFLFIGTTGADQAFYATSDGTSTGSPRAGTYRIYIKMVRTSGAAGLGNYNADSDGNSSVGSIIFNHAGALRGNIQIENVFVPSPTGGVKYAYGASGNELITTTVTHPLKAGATGVETLNYMITRSGVTKKTVSQTLGSGTTDNVSFTCDNQLDTSLQTYDIDVACVGNSGIIAEAWTRVIPYGTSTSVSTSGGGITRQASSFTADPTITIGTITPTYALGNRGETEVISFGITNSRSEALTKSMSWNLRDSLGATKNTITTTGATYTNGAGYTIGAADDGAFDFVGNQWTILLTTADAVIPAAKNAFKVSRKLMIGNAIGSNNLTPRMQYSLYNLGEVVYGDYLVSYARGTAYSGQTGITGDVFTASQVSEFNSVTLRANAACDDMSGRGNHGTATGTPTIGASFLGGFLNAVTFASGQFYDTGTGNGVTTACTLEYRCNNLTQGFLGRWNEGNNNRKEFYLGVRNDNGFAQGSIRINSTDRTLTGSTDIRSGAHALAIDYDGATVRLYVDGAVVASVAATGTVNNAVGQETFYVGKITAAPGALAIQMLGAADAVRVSTIARYAGAYTPATTPFLSDQYTQRLYGFDQGRMPFTYTIATTDASTADNTGAPKHELFSTGGNSTDNSATSHSVSSLYYLHIRTQLSATLAPASYPNIEAGDDLNFVILGDVVNTWAMVTNVRLDQTYINTTGSAIVVQLITPSSVVSSTYSVDSGPSASNGQRNGYTPDISIQPTAPANAWTITGTVNYLGNTATQTVNVTFVTPLTSNLKTRLIMPLAMSAGQSVTVFLETEINDVPAAPQRQPQYRIGKVIPGSPDAFTDIVSATNFVNVVNSTATINGALYKATFTAPTAGNYEFWTIAQLNGNGIRSSIPFSVDGNIAGFNYNGFLLNGVT